MRKMYETYLTSKYYIYFAWFGSANILYLTNVARLSQPEFEEYNKSVPKWKPIQMLSINQIKNVKADDSEVKNMFM